MGNFALIDSYLDTLRRSVGWRPDADEVVAEVEDHLLIAVEREIAVGSDVLAAQRSSLERFGEPRLVSRAFASTSSGGVAVPTHLTRRAGLFGMIGSGLLLLMIVIAQIEQIPLLERNGMQPDEILPGLLVMAISLGSFAGIATLAWGLVTRHGGALGVWGKIGLLLSVLAALVMAMPWLIGPASIVGGIGSLLIGITMLREGMAPTIPTVLYGVGLGLAVGTALILEMSGVGTTDYWGSPVASWIGMLAVIGLIYVPGVFFLGRWLHGETVAEEIEAPLIAS